MKYYTETEVKQKNDAFAFKVKDELIERLLTMIPKSAYSDIKVRH